MRKMRTLLLLACALHLAAEAPDPRKAGMDPARLARIGPRMKAFVDDGKAAGIVTLVARHGFLADLSVSGFQDLESRTPMRADTIFQIASMTKPVTCAAVMILIEEGRLALSDPVEKHLQEFRGQRGELFKPSRPITIRDLMTHTSGMSAGLPPAVKNSKTLAEVVAMEAQQPLRFEPGTKWSYSNAGIATLGRIVEALSGKSYEQFLAERIFAPLGMKDTFPFAPPEKHNRIAAVYTDENGTLKRADIDLYKRGVRYPAPEGGLYSTAADMARFYQMMLGKGTLDGVRILSAASVELMTRVHTGDLTTGFAPGMGYGLGFSVVRNTEGMFRLNSMGAYGHGGAYRTYSWADPAKDLAGVIMLQRTNGGGDVADEITSFMELAAAAIEK
jgi:CubicO group peptidase (beta-lactamase class C family)